MTDAKQADTNVYTRLAILLIVVGALFAADSYLGLAIVPRLWPLLVAMLGIGLIGIYFQRKTTGLLFLGAGEYLVFFSGLALFCNFASWSRIGRLWPLFIIFLGIVLCTLYGFSRQRRLFLFLGLILISLAVFFYAVFAINTRYWWSIFFLVGISILISAKTR